jgi:DNA-directed RNA polymerase specialized sigma24 family protein
VSPRFVASKLGAVAVSSEVDAFERFYEMAFPLVWAFAARRAETRAQAEAMTEAILERAFASPRVRGAEDAWSRELFAIARALQIENEAPAPLRG